MAGKDEQLILLKRKPKRELGENEEDYEEQERIIPPDGGWGWMIVVAGFFAHVLSDGTLYAFGVVLDDILPIFDDAMTMLEVTMIASLLPAVILAIGPLANTLMKLFGPRTTMITGSIIAASSIVVSVFSTNSVLFTISGAILPGIGFGFIYFSVIAIVCYYFEKRRSLAMGLTVAGSGIGLLVSPPLLRLLFKEFGWRATFFGVGLANFSYIGCGFLLRPLKPTKVYVKRQNVKKEDGSKMNSVEEPELERTHSPLIGGENEQQTNNEVITAMAPDASEITQQSKAPKPANFPIWAKLATSLRNSFDFTLFRDIRFLLFCVSSFITSLCHTTAYLFIVAWASQELSFSETSAALLSSFIGLGDIAGRLVFGFLGDRPQIPRLLLYCASIVLCGTIIMLLPLHDAYWWLAAIATGIGSFIAVYISFPPLLLVDMFGLNRFADAFGLLGLIQGVATFVGPVALYQIHNSSSVSRSALFIGSGAAIVFSGLMLIPVYLFCYNKRTLRSKGADGAKSGAEAATSSV